jgi:hypothetical protein
LTIWLGAENGQNRIDMRLLGVDPTRLELVTSAMRGRKRLNNGQRS